jgi:hypothetical protein
MWITTFWPLHLIRRLVLLVFLNIFFKITFKERGGIKIIALTGCITLVKQGSTSKGEPTPVHYDQGEPTPTLMPSPFWSEAS